jgi:hypothetical protein
VNFKRAELELKKEVHVEFESSFKLNQFLTSRAHANSTHLNSFPSLIIGFVLCFLLSKITIFIEQYHTETIKHTKEKSDLRRNYMLD